MKPSSKMSKKAIVDEIFAIRGMVREQSKRIFELSQMLQDRVRREEQDPYSTRYGVFATSSIRFAGTIEQIILRSGTVDRMVLSIDQEKEEAERKAAAQKPRKTRAQASPFTEGLDDLVALFGQEMIDANR